MKFESHGLSATRSLRKKCRLKSACFRSLARGRLLPARPTNCGVMTIRTAGCRGVWPTGTG